MGEHDDLLAQDISRLEGALHELRSDVVERLHAQTAELRALLEAQTELLLAALAPARGAHRQRGSPAAPQDAAAAEPPRGGRTPSWRRPGWGDDAPPRGLGGQAPGGSGGAESPPRCAAARAPPAAEDSPTSSVSDLSCAGRRESNAFRGGPPKVSLASRSQPGADLDAVHLKQHWRACKVEMSTAERFNVREFGRSFVVELLPYFFSGPLLALVCGREEARARLAWPYSGQALFIDILGTGTLWVYLICNVLWYPLPDVSIWDAMFVFLLALCRSITVGVKYALYGQKARGRMRLTWYRKFKRVFVETMSGHVMNYDGMQCIALLEKACISQVRADCDLSSGTVQFICKEDAEACFKIAARLIQQVVDAEAKMAGEGTLDDSRPSVEGPVCPEAWARCKFECLAEEARVIMLQCVPMLLRTDGDECQVPTFAYALYLVHSSHSISEKQGTRIGFVAMFGLGSLVGWLPVVMRGLLGEPAFGSSARANFLLGVHPVLYMYFSHIVLYYAWAPCIFRFRQYKLENQMLKSMLLPRDRQPVRIKWSRATRKAPRLDMTLPGNVLGWAAVWRALHGGGFNSTFQTRANVYCVISFGAIVVGTAFQTVAYEFDRGTFPLPSKVQSFVSLGLMATTVCVHILLSHFSNCLTVEHAAGLQSHRMNIATLIAAAEADEDRRTELMTAFEYLDTLEAEMSAKATAHPVMVGFLKGDIVRLYTILSIFSALLYTDLIRLQEMVNSARQP